MLRFISNFWLHKVFEVKHNKWTSAISNPFDPIRQKFLWPQNILTYVCFNEGNWTQAVRSQGRCFQFWHCFMGVTNWKGIICWSLHIYFDLTSLCKSVFIFIYTCFQLPYEYLTPVQAAIGVVQKVKINHTFMYFISFLTNTFQYLGLTANDPQEHSTEAGRDTCEMLAKRPEFKTQLLWNYWNFEKYNYRGTILISVIVHIEVANGSDGSVR